MSKVRGTEITGIWVDEFTDIQADWINKFVNGNFNMPQGQTKSFQKAQKGKSKKTLREIIEEAVEKVAEAQSGFETDVLLGQMIAPKIWSIYLANSNKYQLKAKKKFVREWAKNLSDTQLQLCLTQFLKQDTYSLGEKRVFTILLTEDKNGVEQNYVSYRKRTHLPYL